MLRFFSLLLAISMPAICLAVQPSSAPTNESKRALDDLASYYADENHAPDMAQVFKDLDSTDADKRSSAGKYLKAILQQSEADEHNGRAQWKKLPYWGGGAESIARKFRTSTAEAFANKARSEEGIDAALWLIHTDPVASDQVAGMKALARIDSPKVSGALRSLLSPPNHNQQVLVGAIELAGKRHLKDLAGTIAPLSGDYRKAIRNAAVSEARELGFKPIDYEPANAFTPWLTDQMNQLVAMVMPAIPADAKWCRFTETIRPPNGQKGKSQTFEQSGWLLQKNDKTIRIVNYFGAEETLPVADTVISERTLKQDADELLTVRNSKGDGEQAMERRGSLSQRGGLTGQFEPGFISVPEALVAAWAFERGDRATAAALVFPRYDDATDERWVCQAVGDILGWHYRDEMLKAFTYDRDYARTIEIGRHLCQHCFDQYSDQKLARELVAQLTIRQNEDFKTLTLPTAADWAAIQKKLNRADQAVYLARRMRLLDCFQWGQPGGVDFDETQYATPQNRQTTAQDTKSTTKPVEVINPYVELQRLPLSVKDLQSLSPFLSDENYVLAYGYWRDFHPARYTYRVNTIISWVLNHAVARQLFDASEFQHADAARQKQMLGSVNIWLQSHSDWSAQKLLTDAATSAQDFDSFASATMRLAKLDHPAAMKLLRSRMDQFKDSRANAVELLYWNDSKNSIEDARRWVKDQDEGVRFWAAMILLHSGKATQEQGLAAISPILTGKDAATYYPQAMDELLAAKQNPAAMKLAVGVIDQFAAHESDFYFMRAPILKRLILSGREEALNYIQGTLNDNTKGGTSSGERDGEEITRQQVVGDSLASELSFWRDGSYSYDSLAPDDVREKKRQELSQWIGDQFKLIITGNPSAIKPDATSLSTSHSQLDAP